MHVCIMQYTLLYLYFCIVLLYVDCVAGNIPLIVNTKYKNLPFTLNNFTLNGYIIFIFVNSFQNFKIFLF